MNRFTFHILLFLLSTFQIFAQGYKDSLIAYWSFEDSTARDFSGNGYHGTMLNNPEPCQGIIGGTAMQFSGGTEVNLTGSHILLPMIDFQSLGNFTMTLWVKEDSVSYKHGEGYIFFGDHFKGWLGIFNAHNLNDPSGNLKRFIQFSVGAGVWTNVLPVFIDYNDELLSSWMFLCLTYENRTLSAYVNGEIKGLVLQDINIYGSNAAMARHWWSVDPFTSARFYGMLDEVKIFKKALTPDEVKEEFDENNCPTYSPEMLASNGNIFCDGDSTTLSLKGSYKGYKWSNGQTSESITVGQWGEYSVEVTDSNGCTGKQSILIYIKPTPKPKIIINQNKVLCEGDSISIGASRKFKEYNWESGEKTQSIYVKKDGWYKLTVTDDNGCKGKDSIYINFIDLPKPEIMVESPALCEGDSAILTSVYNYVRYQWLEEPNETLVGTEKVFITHKSGRYKLKAVTIEGCVLWSDPIDIIISIKQNVLEVIGSGGTMPDESVFVDNRIGKISCKDITIINHGNQTVTISKLSPMENIYFSIPQGQLPITLESGGRKEVTVCFLPDSAGEFRDTIELGDFCNNHYLKLYGICGETYYSGSSRCGFIIRAGQSKTGNIALYPNPTTGTINLSFNAEENTNEDYVIKVMSADGRVMIANNLNLKLSGCQEIILDLNELPSGPYNLSVSSGAWILTRIVILIK